MTRALRRTLRDAPIVWLLILAIGLAAGALRCAAQTATGVVRFSGAAIRPGTLVRVSIGQFRDDPVETFVGQLRTLDDDSLTIIASIGNERIALPRSMIVGLDTSAGNRSRTLWTLGGMALALGAGDLYCTTTKRSGCVILMPIGGLVGLSLAGPIWKRVPDSALASYPFGRTSSRNGS